MLETSSIGKMMNHRYNIYDVYPLTYHYPVWITILIIQAIFVHQTLTEHALYKSQGRTSILDRGHGSNTNHLKVAGN